MCSRTLSIIADARGGIILTRENELLHQIKKGNTSCWDELVSLYYEDILRYCIYHSPDMETAKDAVQETFLKVICYFPRYQNQGKFRGFLYKVASNVCTDLWRRKKTAPLLDDMEFLETGYAQSEAEVNFQHMVRGLPGEQREIVYLRFALFLKEVLSPWQSPAA